MYFPHRNRTLLPPESKRPDQRDQNGYAVTCHRQGDTDCMESESVTLRLEAEEL